MAYTPTDWVDAVTPVNAANLDKLEIAVSKMPYGPDFSSGRVPVWNGSAWANQFIFDGQIAPTAAIALSKLAGYPADATKFARGDGTWAVPPAPPATAYGTTLPASPVDGQEAILVDDPTGPGYQWRLRYNAGHSIDGYKWEYIGGCSWVRNLNGQATTSEVGVPAQTTPAAPSFTVPRTGYYHIHAQTSFHKNVTDGNVQIQVVRASNLDILLQIVSCDTDGSELLWHHMSGMGDAKFLLNASDVISMRFFHTATGTLTVLDPRMLITPVWVA